MEVCDVIVVSQRSREKKREKPIKNKRIKQKYDENEDGTGFQVNVFDPQKE